VCDGNRHATTGARPSPGSQVAMWSVAAVHEFESYHGCRRRRPVSIPTRRSGAGRNQRAVMRLPQCERGVTPVVDSLCSRKGPRGPVSPVRVGKPCRMRFAGPYPPHSTARVLCTRNAVRLFSRECVSLAADAYRASVGGSRSGLGDYAVSVTTCNGGAVGYGCPRNSLPWGRRPCSCGHSW
jgi:hypothetical protein